ncbi:hypothetical protein QOT17_012250 [Balamuthia mandrillaris]
MAKARRSSLLAVCSAFLLPKGEALIFQDFTQLKTEAGGFYQDLIIVWFEREADGQLKSHYQHFLTNEKTERSEEGKKTKKRYTADLNFVAGVWETLLESTWKDFKKLIVFSDGCGQQFKCTKHIAWMRSVACYRNLPVDYNFFASNHGYNQVCDVIGAQVQHTLVCWELDRGSEDKDARLKVPQDIAAVISTTKGHKGSVAPTPKKINKVTMQQGLKDWHQIKYQPDGTLHVWHASTNTVPRATLKFTNHKSFVFTTGTDSRKRHKEAKKQPPLSPAIWDTHDQSKTRRQNTCNCSVSCDAEEETAEHFLLRCPNLWEDRFRIWSVDNGNEEQVRKLIIEDCTTKLLSSGKKYNRAQEMEQCKQSCKRVWRLWAARASWKHGSSSAFYQSLEVM